jgi:SAM-dependent methyltransferase
MRLPDESYDVVICSHVLEHVDDRRALAEIRRVLTIRGLAVLMVPIVEGWDRTYENDAIRSPSERMLHFGQEDHVRFYGSDLRDRIRESGFDLQEFTAIEPDVHLHGLQRGEKLFLALRTD